MRRFAFGIALLIGSGCADRALPPPYAETTAAIPVGELVTIAGPSQMGAGGIPAQGDDTAADPLHARFNFPFDITYGPDGSLYIVDTGNNLIRAIDLAGVLRTVAGSGAVGAATGPLLEASFNANTQLVFRSPGEAALAAAYDSQVKRVDLTSKLVSDECGLGVRTEYTGDGGTAEDAALDVPLSIALRDDHTYILDSQNQVIRVIDAEGTITRFAGACVVSAEWDGSACAPATTPMACPGSNKTTTCTESDACERPCTPGDAGDGGPASALRMAQPNGESALDGGRLAFDADGDLYFSDTGNQRIRKIDRAGLVTTVAGNGSAGAGGDGGPAPLAQLDRPTDLAFDTDGTLYIADTGNSCIRALGADGNIRTVAGICGAAGYEGPSGVAISTPLNHPRGVEVDGHGLLYIADTSNNVIRAVRLRP